VWIDRKRKVIRQEEKKRGEKPIRNEGPAGIISNIGSFAVQLLVLMT
jgi:hypothetical protein